MFRGHVTSLRHRHDLDDERVLIGLTAGVLSLVGAIAAAVCQLLPGAPAVDTGTFVGLDTAVFLYGVAAISGAIDWSRISVSHHALGSAVLLPLLGVTLWATGGSASYLQPLLILPLVHVAFAFPARLSFPLVVELVAIMASPIAYERGAGAYVPQVVAFAFAAFVLLAVLRLLKGGLVEARERQRRMALADPLTGLVNRRGFDAALRAATVSLGAVDVGRRSADEGPGFALVLIDLDDFKDVNDTHGHLAGDQLLRSVAAHASAVVRPTDTLARIGGDEFAVVAPGAGVDGAQRLVLALEDAVADAGAKASVAYAVHPADGDEGEELLRVADRRLYASKSDRVG